MFANCCMSILVSCLHLDTVSEVTQSVRTDLILLDLSSLRYLANNSAYTPQSYAIIIDIVINNVKTNLQLC